MAAQRNARPAGVRPVPLLTTIHFVLIALLFVSLPAGAQTAAVLQGRVLDASGAVLPGALVRVRNDSTGYDRSVSADHEGRYHVAAIDSGTYVVTAEAAGFRTER